jgi:Copper/zinc superoxide dismutase (SODC)
MPTPSVACMCISLETILTDVRALDHTVCPFPTIVTSFLREEHTPSARAKTPEDVRSSPAWLLILCRCTVNPFGKQHGAPEDSDRHVGDLGNITTDGQGNAKGYRQDSQVKLIGEQSVLGVRLLLLQDLYSMG